MLIPIPLTEEEEAQQLHETMERIMVKKQAFNISYVEGIRSLALELERKKLEATTKRKREMEMARVTG